MTIRSISERVTRATSSLGDEDPARRVAREAVTRASSSLRDGDCGLSLRETLGGLSESQEHSRRSETGTLVVSSPNEKSQEHSLSLQDGDSSFPSTPPSRREASQEQPRRFETGTGSVRRTPNGTGLDSNSVARDGDRGRYGTHVSARASPSLKRRRQRVHAVHETAVEKMLAEYACERKHTLVRSFCTR